MFIVYTQKKKKNNSEKSSVKRVYIFLCFCFIETNLIISKFNTILFNK